MTPAVLRTNYKKGKEEQWARIRCACRGRNFVMIILQWMEGHGGCGRGHWEIGSGLNGINVGCTRDGERRDERLVRVVRRQTCAGGSEDRRKSSYSQSMVGIRRARGAWEQRALTENSREGARQCGNHAPVEHTRTPVPSVSHAWSCTKPRLAINRVEFHDQSKERASSK